MARQYSVSCPSATLTAATAKTLIELTAGASTDFVVIEFDITFNGTTASAVPVTVDLVRYDTTGTGSAATPVKYRADADIGSNTTAKTNMTVEGTGTITVVRSWFVPPTSGFFMQFPLGREPSGTASKSFGLRATAPAGVNAIANVVFEE